MDIQQHGINEQHLNIIYTFAFRLSGNEKVAEKLTTNVFLEHYTSGDKEILLLLKNLWQDFRESYGFLPLQGEKPAQKILLALPPELRSVVILKDIFGYRYEQIAAVLDIIPQEVSRMLTQGRQEMRKICQRCK